MGGRLIGEDNFHSLEDGLFPHPNELPKDLFVAIPKFRMDISSTQLRQMKDLHRHTQKESVPQAE